MSVCLDEARELALSLPEAVEQDHHGRPSFRVGGRIFATLWSAEQMNVMLDEGGILTAVDARPAACREVWWGKRLAAVGVALERIDPQSLRELLADAWEQKAPKRLLPTRVTEVLEAHVRRFNDAVRSGDYAEMVQGFAPDAEMVFEGVPAGPFRGRAAIAEAYASRPPTDEVRLLGEPRVEGETVESDYAWAAEGSRAGRMIVTTRGGRIARLVVTFE